MERPSGGEQKAAWRAGFQPKDIRHFAAVLRHGKIERAASGLIQSRALKQAADLSLAMAERGRTSWSRAILRKYLSRVNRSASQRRSVVKSRVNFPSLVTAKKSRPGKTTFPGKKSLKRLFRVASKSGSSIRSEKGTLVSRMQTLRELIPGSRPLNTPVFLEEAADYIVVLMMQVQGMQALTGCYTN